MGDLTGYDSRHLIRQLWIAEIAIHNCNILLPPRARSIPIAARDFWIVVDLVSQGLVSTQPTLSGDNSPDFERRVKIPRI